MDYYRPMLLLHERQGRVLSTFDEDDTAIPILRVDLPTGEMSAQAEGEYLCWQASELRDHWGADVTLMGSMQVAPLTPKPHGDTEFPALVAYYATKAKALENAGCHILLAKAMPSLVHARAAVLGARSVSRLPIWVSADLDRTGRELEDGADVLAAFITLQALGIAAFGFGHPDTGEMMLPHFKLIAPYADIPLFASPECTTEDKEEVLTPVLFSQLVQRFITAGVSILGAGYGAGSGHLMAAKAVLEAQDTTQTPKPSHKDDIIACTENQAFFLDENLEFSEPLDCTMDMTEELIHMETSGCDVICIALQHPDDGYHFAQNAPMLGMPVAFLSDDEALLEDALFYYNGRGIIDSRSLLERDVLEALAKRYGAVVV